MAIQIKSLGSGSGGNCYRLSDGFTQILLECGLTVKKIRKGLDFQLSGIAACLVSHGHGYHSKSVKDLIKLGIPCYMSPGCSTSLWLDGDSRCHWVYPRQIFTVGTLTVYPFETVHDSETHMTGDTLGYYIKSQATGEFILFVTDTAYIKPKFKRLDYIMCECNYSEDAIEQSLKSGGICQAQYKRIVSTHFGLNNVVEFLKANDLSHLKEIYLLHLSNGNSDEALILKTIRQFTGVPVVCCAE